MLGYNDLYETLRKEKNSENLQLLTKNFLEEFTEYINDKSEFPQKQTALFSDSIAKSQKQRENSLSMFRELMLKRKKKMLNLVFVATETGIMKKDSENMLAHEKETFESLVKTFENNDETLKKLLTKKIILKEENKLILFNTKIEQFIDHEGNTIGPFNSGQLANLDSNIANILVSEKKATYIDEE